MSNNSPKIVLASVQKEIFDCAVVALNQTSLEAVNFLRKKTSKRQPPAKKGEASRQAHPGGWADITGNLANSISNDQARVKGGSIVGTLFSDRDYAQYLEGKSRKAGGSYFVVQIPEKQFNFQKTFQKELYACLS